jgi:hypothetical protein
MNQQSDKFPQSLPTQHVQLTPDQTAMFYRSIDDNIPPADNPDLALTRHKHHPNFVNSRQEFFRLNTLIGKKLHPYSNVLLPNTMNRIYAECQPQSLTNYDFGRINLKRRLDDNT